MVAIGFAAAALIASGRANVRVSGEYRVYVKVTYLS